MEQNFQQEQLMNTLSGMNTEQLFEVLNFALELGSVRNSLGVVDQRVPVGRGHIPHQIND